MTTSAMGNRSHNFAYLRIFAQPYHIVTYSGIGLINTFNLMKGSYKQLQTYYFLL